MARALEMLNDEERRVLVAKRQPSWSAPMLATLTKTYFSSPEWIFEPKFDGVRCLAFRNGSRLRILSRNRKPMNNIYPELVEALAKQRTRDFVIDGEIVAFDGKVTSFERLQGRLGISDPVRARKTGIAVYLYVFDLLYLDGFDTTRLELRRRKQLLKAALSFHGRLRYTTHRNGDGEKFLAEACRRGWEGLIAKRAAAAYVHKRSRDWLKFKCGARQELVIGGYTDPRGSRIGFGALLVGTYDGTKLRYAGKVGTGYDDVLLQRLGKRMRRLERDACPFSRAPREKGVHWIRPVLVVEVGFTEWTHDGKLRHPRFLGLRTDKPARQVHRERARASR